MNKTISEKLAEHMKLIPEVTAAHERANRAALLEHARMGRSVCESRDGQVVWITPAEIFARYGLDPHGQPKA
ncbi:MAG: hypothetical protein LC104_14280 [Bacteroidales bacterium]|nr:hypothetical protein [Bacteroidales bacterium]